MSDEKTFVCDNCGKVELYGNEAVADLEALALWGIENASARDDVARVCDGCFEQINSLLGVE